MFPRKSRGWYGAAAGSAAITTSSHLPASSPGRLVRDGLPARLQGWALLPDLNAVRDSTGLIPSLQAGEEHCVVTVAVTHSSLSAAGLVSTSSRSPGHLWIKMLKGRGSRAGLGRLLETLPAAWQRSWINTLRESLNQPSHWPSHRHFYKAAFVQHLAAIQIQRSDKSPMQGLWTCPLHPHENKIRSFSFVLEKCMSTELGHSQNSDQNIPPFKPSCGPSVHVE